MALASEILDHSSPALSWMVAWSPVPNAARTPGMALMSRLTVGQAARRATSSSDVYA